MTVTKRVRSRSAPSAVTWSGVDVGVERLDQAQIELAEKLDVAIDPLEHRIDDQHLAARCSGKEVRCTCWRRDRRAGGISSLVVRSGGATRG
jgi:hypothetical protein